MATDFGRPNNGNYFYGDFTGAPIVLPAGDFAIQFWSRLDSNAGSLFQYLLANATGSSATGATLIYTVEAGQGSANLVNKWHAAFRNDAGVLQYQDSNAMAEQAAVGDGIEKLIVFQRRAGRLAFHICHKGGTPFTSGGNPSSTGTFTIQKLWIGVRGDNDALRRFKENAGQFGILSRSLSDAEIQALAVGDIDVRAVAAPADIMGYWDLEDGTATGTDLSGNGRHLTRFGSPATADFRFVTEASGGGVYELPAATGSFSVAGQPAGLVVARRMPADAGSLQATGQSAGVFASRRLVAEAGDFALTGHLAGLARGKALVAGAGACILTGQSAALRVLRRIGAGSEAIALAGQPAALTHQKPYTPGRLVVSFAVPEARRSVAVGSPRVSQTVPVSRFSTAR